MNDLEILKTIPPWEWPESAGQTFIDTIRDENASLEDRVVAAELAGDTCAISDEVAECLLGILNDDKQPDLLRARSAIAFGAVLEDCDTEGFDGPYADLPISEDMYNRIRADLRAAYERNDVPKEVRRRVLEAAVRAPEEWHASAIGTAFASSDPDWKLTAIFCMGQLPGFESEIVANLKNPKEELRIEALRAAGNRGLEEALPHVEALLHSKNTDRDLLFDAIAAASGIGTPAAIAALMELAESTDDEEIAEAASEAAMDASALAGDPFVKEDDDEE